MFFRVGSSNRLREVEDPRSIEGKIRWMEGIEGAPDFQEFHDTEE